MQSHCCNILYPVVVNLSLVLYEIRGIHPYTLPVCACLCNTSTFLLPLGTPTNSIAYATGRVSLMDFLKQGLGLNIVAVLFYAFVVPIAVPIFF